MQQIAKVWVTHLQLGIETPHPCVFFPFLAVMPPPPFSVGYMDAKIPALYPSNNICDEHRLLLRVIHVSHLQPGISKNLTNVQVLMELPSFRSHMLHVYMEYFPTFTTNLSQMYQVIQSDLLIP